MGLLLLLLPAVAGRGAATEVADEALSGLLLPATAGRGAAAELLEEALSGRLTAAAAAAAGCSAGLLGEALRTGWAAPLLPPIRWSFSGSWSWSASRNR